MADQPTQEQIDQIADALASGRKIAAIKVYREATGKGLKDAKDFIEALIPQLKEQDPEKYAAISGSPGGAGCASVILLGLALLTACVLPIFC